MCLIIKKGTLPKLAEKDIHVFKALNRGNKAVAYNFKYEPNELYTTEFEMGSMMCADEVASRALDEEFSHSWPSLAQLTSIGQGFHFCFTEERANKLGKAYSSLCVVQSFTVPKGAYYYEDNSGLGVANQIIMGQPVRQENELQNSQG